MNKDQIESQSDTDFGDRKMELVFIGQNLEKEKMIVNLEARLLTDREIQL